MLHFDVPATYIQQSVLVLRSNYLDEIEAQLPLCHKKTQDYFSELSKKDSMWIANQLHKDNELQNLSEILKSKN